LKKPTHEPFHISVFLVKKGEKYRGDESEAMMNKRDCVALLCGEVEEK
jgi:hypothetical protein